MARNRRLPPREKRLSFRVAAEEYAALENAARKDGVTVSTFLRAAFPALLSETGRIQKARPRRSQDESVMHCQAMLTRIYRNVQALGQWTAHCREGADAVSIMAHLVAVERELDRLTSALDRPTPKGFGPARQRA